jgi:hypothetical protein
MKCLDSLQPSLSPMGPSAAALPPPLPAGSPMRLLRPALLALALTAWFPICTAGEEPPLKELTGRYPPPPPLPPPSLRDTPPPLPPPSLPTATFPSVKYRRSSKERSIIQAQGGKAAPLAADVVAAMQDPRWRQAVVVTAYSENHAAAFDPWYANVRCNYPHAKITAFRLDDGPLPKKDDPNFR